MGDSWKTRYDLTDQIIAAALFLCTAASISAFLTNPGIFPWEVFRWGRPDKIAAALSPLVFLCGSVLILTRPRFGYSLGLLGCLLALPLFVRTEISPSSWNSWTFLNHDGSTYFRGNVPAYVKLRLLSDVLIVTAVSTSSIHLLPGAWSIHNSVLRQR